MFETHVSMGDEIEDKVGEGVHTQVLDSHGLVLAAEPQHGGHFVAGGELESIEEQGAVF